MIRLEIPIWEKAIITVQEASALAGGMNDAIIRLHAAQSMYYGRNYFECYKTGNKLCIVKDSFLKWLSLLGRRHEEFDLNRCREELQLIIKKEEQPQETIAVVKRGRPRKNREVQYEQAERMRII